MLNTTKQSATGRWFLQLSVAASHFLGAVIITGMIGVVLSRDIQHTMTIAGSDACQTTAICSL